jgi:hypothetical protein
MPCFACTLVIWFLDQIARFDVTVMLDLPRKPVPGHLDRESHEGERGEDVEPKLWNSPRVEQSRIQSLSFVE